MSMSMSATVPVPDPYQRALFVLQKMTCIPSALGSLMIVSQVVRSEVNRQKTQQRLMLCISLVDFQTSLVWIFSWLFVPSGQGMLYAVGNQTTCNVQGFVVQFSTAGILYMCSLQFQYLLVIKYGWGEKRILRVEKWLHLFPIVFALATATAALVLDQYNHANWDCWIAPLNKNGGSECTSTYEINHGNTDLTETDCVRGDNAEIYRWAFFLGPLWASILFCIVTMAMVYHVVRKTTKKSDKWQFPFPGRKKKPKERKSGIAAEVKRQSFRYSFAFLIVWAFPTISRLIQLCGGEIHPILSVLSGTFIGAQGLLNALIYFRPRYDKCVKYDRWYEKVWALIHSTLFFCCYDDDYTKDAKDYQEPNEEPTESFLGESNEGEEGDRDEEEHLIDIDESDLHGSTV